MNINIMIDQLISHEIDRNEALDLCFNGLKTNALMYGDCLLTRQLTELMLELRISDNSLYSLKKTLEKILRMETGTIQDIVKLKHITIYPDFFKIKTPVENSVELDLMYNFVFDHLQASWAGRIGHYPYGDKDNIAENQDGFIYVYYDHNNRRTITASPRTASMYANGQMNNIKIINSFDYK